MAIIPHHEIDQLKLFTQKGKKLLGTSASLLVTSALLVVTSALLLVTISNKCLAQPSLGNRKGVGGVGSPSTESVRHGAAGAKPSPVTSGGGRKMEGQMECRNALVTSDAFGFL